MYRPLKKSAQQVDLIQQHSLCEINYARLLKLIPYYNEQDHFQLSVSHGQHIDVDTCAMSIAVLQRAPYTTLISIKMDASWGRWVTLPEMEVRLYHDVLMAEVVMAQQVRRFPFVTEYPNSRMSLPNEKALLNQFLSELLDFCMSGGHVPESVF